MLAVLSPAKTLDFSPAPAGLPVTVPERLDESAEIIAALRKLSAAKLAKLMDISAKLAELNTARHEAWSPEFPRESSKPALLAFDGDVYQGFDFDLWRKPDFVHAQRHLRILSGLHGLLRPLDLIQAYRLEMGTPLKMGKARDLYAYWGDKITLALNDALATAGSDTLVNLASEEYFGAVRPEKLSARVVQCVFKDESNGAWKILSFFAKRARGLMADFIVRERLTEPRQLRQFDAGGYRFHEKSSSEATLVFHRPACARPKPATKARPAKA